MTIRDTEILEGPPWPIEGRRKQILDFIRKYKTRTGISPNRQEIATHLDTSMGGVKHYLRQLEEDGWIAQPVNVPYTKRNLVLVGEVYLLPEEGKRLLERLESVKAGKRDVVRFLDYLEKLINRRRFMPKEAEEEKDGEPIGETV